jgi:hypothetical protein
MTAAPATARMMVLRVTLPIMISSLAWYVSRLAPV